MGRGSSGLGLELGSEYSTLTVMIVGVGHWVGIGLAVAAVSAHPEEERGSVRRAERVSGKCGTGASGHRGDLVKCAYGE